jgi:methionyl aminopeptidase
LTGGYHVHLMSIETQADLDGLQRVGRVVAATIAEARRRLRPGMTTADLDAIGEEVFSRYGARSAPRERYGFPGCLCLSVNDEAVHGVPGDRVLREGDLVKVDVTAELAGYVADACESLPVGSVDRPAERLRATAAAALRRGMAVATAGARTGDVGAGSSASSRRAASPCCATSRVTGWAARSTSRPRCRAGARPGRRPASPKGS